MQSGVICSMERSMQKTTQMRNCRKNKMQERGRRKREAVCFRRRGNVFSQAAMRVLAIMVFACCLTVIFHMPVLAGAVNPDADTSQFSQVTNGLNTLLSLFKIVVMIIGGIIVLKNGLELGSAVQQQDSNGIKSGLMGMAGGGVALASAAILGLFQ